MQEMHFIAPQWRIDMSAEVAVALGLRYHTLVRHPAAIEHVDKLAIRILVPVPGMHGFTAVTADVSTGRSRARVLERLGREPARHEVVWADLELVLVLNGHPFVGVARLEGRAP